MGWFITQSLLFIIIAAVVFFLIGLWVGWILWARRGKGTGRHTADAGAERKQPANRSAAKPEKADEPATTGTEPETEKAGTTAVVGTDSEAEKTGEPVATGTEPEPEQADESAAETDSTSSPSEIEDENLAIYAGAEHRIVAEAEAATREAAVGKNQDSDDATARDDADLTRIEGIGPKIADALRKAGYGSYQKIADASEADLRAALATSGITFSPAAASFAAQAQYLVDGDDEGLAEYQDYLIAGRDRKSTTFVEDVDYTDVDEVDGAEAKAAALAADAAKVAEATGSDEAVDTSAVADDAAASDAPTDIEAADTTAADTGAAAEASAKQQADDDLRVIEGIGPKIATALKADGITSYAQIAAMDEEALLAAIRKNGIKFAPSVSSWAHQAQYLVDGDSAGLDEYQDYLIGGQDRGKTAFVKDVDYTDIDEIEGAEAKKAALEADAKKVAEAEGGHA